MRRFIAATLLLSVLAAGAWLFILNQSEPSSEAPSEDSFLQFITDTFPLFTEKNEPVIAVDSISRHENNWYIVTIKSIHDVEVFVPVRIIVFYREGLERDPSVILGPDTHFTETEMLSNNIPDSIIRELRDS